MTSTPPIPPPPPPGPGPGPIGAPVAAPAASGRNRAAALIALVGIALVLVGTALPIVEFDFSGGAAGDLVAGGDSASGWGDGLNDGPIHLIVAMLPLVAAFAILRGGARVWAKVVLILGAVIGFFWVSIRFADISGSLDEGAIAELTAQISDPGLGLYAITSGWMLVLLAGFVTKSVRPSSGAPTTF